MRFKGNVVTQARRPLSLFHGAAMTEMESGGDACVSARKAAVHQKQNSDYRDVKEESSCFLAKAKGNKLWVPKSSAAYRPTWMVQVLIIRDSHTF